MPHWSEVLGYVQEGEVYCPSCFLKGKPEEPDDSGEPGIITTLSETTVSGYHCGPCGEEIVAPANAPLSVRFLTDGGRILRKDEYAIGHDREDLVEMYDKHLDRGKCVATWIDEDGILVDCLAYDR